MESYNRRTTPMNVTRLGPDEHMATVNGKPVVVKIAPPELDEQGKRMMEGANAINQGCGCIVFMLCVPLVLGIIFLLVAGVMTAFNGFR